mmetsp:Transcript_100220/g.299165  ORF Transcript_100220/g.299165 Transcript_100220/m.299165 type:complete len:343 (-) Transcript_100220:845-1873(-)
MRVALGELASEDLHAGGAPEVNHQEVHCEDVRARADHAIDNRPDLTVGRDVVQRLQQPHQPQEVEVAQESAIHLEEQVAHRGGRQDQRRHEVEAVVGVLPVLAPGPVGELEADLQEIDQTEEDINDLEEIRLPHVVQVDRRLADHPEDVGRQHNVHEGIEERALEARVVAEVGLLGAIVQDAPEEPSCAGAAAMLTKPGVPPRDQEPRLQHVAHDDELLVREHAVGVPVQGLEDQAQKPLVRAYGLKAPQQGANLNEVFEAHREAVSPRRALLDQLKGGLQAEHPAINARLDSCCGLLLVVAVDRCEQDIREDHRGKHQEGQPQHREVPTVDVGGDHDVWGY